MFQECFRTISELPTPIVRWGVNSGILGGEGLTPRRLTAPSILDLYTPYEDGC
jgi:hypothetical protein